MSDELDETGKALTIAGQLVSLAKESPELNEAGQSFANSARTVAKAVENVLLPIAAVNFAVQKSRNYFEQKFGDDLEDALSNVPEDKIIDPKPSVVAPAMQALAFSHEETSLKDMYVKLIATAMTERRKNEAHPAFVEVIKQITAEEAQLLNMLLQFEIIPAVELRIQDSKSGSYGVVHEHLIDLRDMNTGKAAVLENCPAMLENWMRLGLFVASYSRHLNQKGSYDWVEQRPEYLKLSNDLEKRKTIVLGKGAISRTSFGENFLKAIA